MITREQITNLVNRDDICILETHKAMPKVIETASAQIIKFFYPKKWPSSNHYYPYAIRFCENAVSLNQMGFKAPEIVALNYCPDLDIYIIGYAKIRGQNIHKLDYQHQNTLLENVIKFICSLHEKGIYFRSLHLSNLLYQDNHELALIDIADMKIKKKSLSVYARGRNLQRMFAYDADLKTWLNFGIERALSIYEEVSSLNKIKMKMLRFLI